MNVAPLLLTALAMPTLVVVGQMPLDVLLPAVIAGLGDPGLGRVGEGPGRAGPVEVFALVGPLVAGAVVETVVGGREAVGPILRVGGEAGGPG